MITGIPVLLSTTTATNSANVAITSNITSAYNEYVFVFTDVNPVTDSQTLTFNVSIDGGSNYNVAKTTTFWRAQNNGSSNALGYQTSLDLANSTAYQPISADLGNGSDESTAGILHVFDPASTTYVKHFNSRFNCHHASNYTNDMFAAGFIDSTSAINAVNFKMASGNFDGVIQMYGIK